MRNDIDKQIQYLERLQGVTPHDKAMMARSRRPCHLESILALKQAVLKP